MKKLSIVFLVVFGIVSAYTAVVFQEPSRFLMTAVCGAALWLRWRLDRATPHIEVSMEVREMSQEEINALFRMRHDPYWAFRNASDLQQAPEPTDAEKRAMALAQSNRGW